MRKQPVHIFDKGRVWEQQKLFLADYYQWMAAKKGNNVVAFGALLGVSDNPVRVMLTGMARQSGVPVRPKNDILLALAKILGREDTYYGYVPPVVQEPLLDETSEPVQDPNRSPMPLGEEIEPQVAAPTAFRVAFIRHAVVSKFTSLPIPGMGDAQWMAILEHPIPVMVTRDSFHPEDVMVMLPGGTVIEVQESILLATYPDLWTETIASNAQQVVGAMMDTVLYYTYRVAQTSKAKESAVGDLKSELATLRDQIGPIKEVIKGVRDLRMDLEDLEDATPEEISSIIPALEDKAKALWKKGRPVLKRLTP